MIAPINKVLTEKDNNTTVVIEKGHDLAIKLTYNPSSGYIWNSTACTAGVLKNIKHDPVPTPIIPGAPNNITFTFNITSDGVIVLDCARSSDNPVDNPAKLFVAIVKTKMS